MDGSWKFLKYEEQFVEFQFQDSNVNKTGKKEESQSLSGSAVNFLAVPLLHTHNEAKNEHIDKSGKGVILLLKLPY